MRKKRPALVLAIGGFDPSCGAGVVADARSIEAMGALPLAVVTAITIQSGTGVRSFAALPPKRVLAQLDELFANLPIAAVKIGQVPGAALARALAGRLAKIEVPVVLDPVLVASGGGRLTSAGAARAIVSWLVPRATLVTVNLSEAAMLTSQQRIRSVAGMSRAALALEQRGARNVFVKGGHLAGEPIDLLRQDGQELVLRSSRIAGSMHGTGCALASAAAARLALGDDVESAVRAARDHVRRLLRGAVRIGRSRLRPAHSY